MDNTSREPYPSDLSDTEWAVIEPLIPSSSKLGRPPRYSKREVINAIFYVTRGGCTWRMMPHDLPSWRISYHYFALWKHEEIWDLIHDTLRDMVRVSEGKKKARALRHSTRKAFALLADAEFQATMQARR